MVDQTPFEWTSQHLQLIGWPVVVTMAWKLRGVFANIEDRAETVEKSTLEMKTNHIPHLQEALNSIDKNLAVLVALAQQKKD